MIPKLLRDYGDIPAVPGFVFETSQELPQLLTSIGNFPNIFEGLPKRLGSFHKFSDEVLRSARNFPKSPDLLKTARKFL